MLTDIAVFILILHRFKFGIPDKVGNRDFLHPLDIILCECGFLQSLIAEQFVEKRI